MNIHIVFTKPTDPEVKTEPPVVLWTDPTVVYPANDTMRKYCVTKSKTMKELEVDGLSTI